MSTDSVLDDFLRVINDPTYGVYHQVAPYLMGHVFCADTGTLPCVGITDYGPQFIGAPDVQRLFTQLFTSFPDLSMNPTPPPTRFYSTDQTGISIQATLAGTQVAEWFPKGDAHYSPPLSGITPDKIYLMKVPACAVFTFDAAGPAANHIVKISIYTDRHRMARQLTPAA